MNCVITDEMMAAAQEAAVRRLENRCRREPELLTGSDGTERPQAAVRAAVAELRRLLAVQPKLTAEMPNQEQEDGFDAFDPERPHGQHPAYGEADVLAAMRDLLIEDAQNLKRRAAGARQTAAVIARHLGRRERLGDDERPIRNG